MIQSILIALTISLVCLAIYASTWKGMIFNSISIKVEKWIIKMTSFNIGVMICKPLFKCLICMSSFWTIFIWIITGFKFNIFIVLPVVCGINVILTSLIANILPDE